MIDRAHDLPITKQAQVLRISRGSVYYLPRPVPASDLEVMRRLDRLHLDYPFAGSRMLRGLLAADVFGSGGGNGAAPPAVDVKSLHAKIGELTLENDFLEGALTKAGLLSAKR